jgi:hypothetical protein
LQIAIALGDASVEKADATREEVAVKSPSKT